MRFAKRLMPGSGGVGSGQISRGLCRLSSWLVGLSDEGFCSFHYTGSLSRVLASCKASRRLKCLDNFCLSSVNLEVVEALADLLLSKAVLEGLSELDLGLDVEAFSFSIYLAFFSSGPLKPGDCSFPGPSTAYITDTEAGSTREGLRVS